MINYHLLPDIIHTWVVHRSQDCLQTRSSVFVGTGVFVLFLRIANYGVLVFAQLLFDYIEWKRSDLKNKKLSNLIKKKLLNRLK